MPPVSEEEVAVTEGGAGALSEEEVAVTEGGVGALSRADCLCPVCLEVFLEPVTLPCAHSFCKPCFQETVDKANLCCPLCRKRVSTWARLNGRKKTLVNVELWSRVQAAFPLQCQRRISGQEEDEESTSVSRPRVSQPGEVRREYEDQISKLAEEKRALEEAERKASEEYIQHLLAEEEERLAEERRRQEERQLETDENLARLLSQEWNPIPISESQKNMQPNDITPAKKRNHATAGDIERFLCPFPQRHSSGSETSSNKENIRHSDMKPRPSQELPEHPTPSLAFPGRQGSPRLQCETAASAEITHHPTDPSLKQTPPHNTPREEGTSTKRKSCDIEQSGEGDMASKRPCSSSSLPQRGEAQPDPGEALLFQELAQREEQLFSRRQQEEEDRRMALRVQKRLDREEALRAVDRSKGSRDQYQLRQNPGPSRGPSHSSTSKEARGRAEKSPPGPTPQVEQSSTQRRAEKSPPGPTPQVEQSSTQRRAEKSPPGPTPQVEQSSTQRRAEKSPPGPTLQVEQSSTQRRAEKSPPGPTPQVEQSSTQRRAEKSPPGPTPQVEQSSTQRRVEKSPPGPTPQVEQSSTQRRAEKSPPGPTPQVEQSSTQRRASLGATPSSATRTNTLRRSSKQATLTEMFPGHPH